MGLQGLILAGGRSERMGQNKALMSKDGDSWLSRSNDLLSHFSPEVRISCRADQVDQYQSLMPEVQCIADNPNFEGVYAALLTSHQTHPKAAWMVLAVDYPYLEVEVLQMLHEAHKASPTQTVAIKCQNQRHPLIGIYTPQFLEPLHEKSSGHMPSLQKQVGEYGVFIDLPPRFAYQLRNCNTPDDYQFG